MTISSKTTSNRPSINNIFQTSLWTICVQIAKMVLQFISQLILARLLFPSDFGLLAMAAPIFALTGVITDLGLGQAIIQRKDLEYVQISSLFWINLALSCSAAVFLIVVSPLVAIAFGEPKLSGLMAVLSLLIPISVLNIHPTAFLTRNLRFGLIAKLDILSTAAGIVTTILTARAGLSYWSLVVGQAVTNATSCLLNWYYCGWRPSKPHLTCDISVDFRFGGYLTGANLATFVTTSADNIIAGVFAGIDALGLYDRSYRLVIQPIGQLTAPISRIAVPLLARLTEQPDEYRSAYLQILMALYFLSLPILLVCLSSGALVVHVLLGDRWSNATPVFVGVCFGGTASALYTSLYFLFVSQGRTIELMKSTVLISIASVASFGIGAFWGIVGIALVGSFVFVFFSTPLMTYYATKTGPVSLGDVARCVGSSLVCGAATFILLINIGEKLASGNLTKLIELTSLAYGLYAILSLLFPRGRQSAKYIINLYRRAT